jgi:hypothetical protein
MKAARQSATATAPAEHPNLVALMDAIDKEATDIMGLTDVLQAVGLITSRHADDTAMLLDGVGIVARILREKIEEITEKANAIYDAYTAMDGGAR